MYDGIYYVTLLITIVCGFIDLMSGNFARAATAGTVLFILACISGLPTVVCLRLSG